MQKVLPTNAILIPDNANQVFEGQIFSFWQWPQQLFDGSNAKFEMLKRPDTVQVVVAKDNQILLVEDEQPGRTPRVHFPGGRADDEDESWLAAAQRELKEDAGLVCAQWRLIDVTQPLPKIEWFVPIFLATDIKQEGEQRLDPGGEKINLQWTDFMAMRRSVMSGDEPTMTYLLSLLARIDSFDNLLAAPEFTGQIVDR